jgi:DNA-binding NarL/FixJ family response regulator
MRTTDDTSIRVVIVARSRAMRESLAAALGRSGMTVVAEAGTLAEWHPDARAADILVVTDNEALGDLDDAPMEVGVLVMGGANTRLPGELLRGGRPGWGVLPTSATPDEVAAAIQAITRGLVVLPARAARHLLSDGVVQRSERDDPDLVEEPLTPRELNVLDLVSEWHSNKVIAARLGISEHTVKFHLSSICGKLGASSRTEAVRLGVRRGLITL